MKYALTCLVVLLSAQQAAAASSDYGPAKRWQGIGYKFGYEDDFAKDGSWRVKARTRHGHGEDMAVYRAAERAREAGYEYIQLLSGRGQDGPGFSYAEVDALPSHSPAPPSTCRSKKRGTCYTADVDEVLRRLSGDTGREPGVAVTDHLDQYGRRVSYSGFGTGAVAATAAARPVTSAIARPMMSQVLAILPKQSFAEQLDALLAAARPVRGREPDQGWTVTD